MHSKPSPDGECTNSLPTFSAKIKFHLHLIVCNHLLCLSEIQTFTISQQAQEKEF